MKYCLPSQTVTDDLTVDTFVMLAEPHLPQALCSISRVVKVTPSTDSHIRDTEVKVGDKVDTHPHASRTPR